MKLCLMKQKEKFMITKWDMGNLNIKILIIHKQPVQGTDKEYTVMTSMRM